MLITVAIELTALACCLWIFRSCLRERLACAANRTSDEIEADLLAESRNAEREALERRLTNSDAVFNPGVVASIDELMKSEPFYQKLDKMASKLRTGLLALEPLKGKDVVLLVGQTGSGKSTIANSLISGSRFVHYDDEDGVYKAESDLMLEGRHMFQIGHSTKSCTQIPGYYPLSDSLYLVDAPGFGDSNIFLEFPNLTLIHEVIKHANKVTICVVLKGSTIDA